MSERVQNYESFFFCFNRITHVRKKQLVTAIFVLALLQCSDVPVEWISTALHKSMLTLSEICSNIVLRTNEPETKVENPTRVGNKCMIWHPIWGKSVLSFLLNVELGSLISVVSSQGWMTWERTSASPFPSMNPSVSALSSTLHFLHSFFCSRLLYQHGIRPHEEKQKSTCRSLAIDPWPCFRLLIYCFTWCVTILPQNTIICSKKHLSQLSQDKFEHASPLFNCPLESRHIEQYNTLPGSTKRGSTSEYKMDHMQITAMDISGACVFCCLSLCFCVKILCSIFQNCLTLDKISDCVEIIPNCLFCKIIFSNFQISSWLLSEPFPSLCDYQSSIATISKLT